MCGARGGGEEGGILVDYVATYMLVNYIYVTLKIVMSIQFYSPDFLRFAKKNKKKNLYPVDMQHFWNGVSC